MVRRAGFLIALAAAAAGWGAPPPGRATEPAAARAQAPRPIEHFARLPFFDGPKLSPDGTKVAARIAVAGQQYLATFPVFGNKTAPNMLAVGDQDANWWHWVNDDWLVIGIGATDDMGGTDVYVSRAIGVSADLKKINKLAFREAGQDADDLVWVADDGTPRILLAVQRSVFAEHEGFWPEVLEVNVATGNTKRVVRPHIGVLSWYADAAGTVRIGIGRGDDGRSARLLYRKKDGDIFRVVDRIRPRRDDKLLVPVLFLAEPGQAIAFHDKDGYDALYKLDLDTLELGEKVFGADGYDVDAIIRDPKGSYLAGAVVVKDGPQVHWFDPGLAQVQADLDKAVPGRRAAIVSMDRSQRRLLVHVGGPDRPGAYYFYDRGHGSMQRLAYINEAIGSAPLHPVRTVRYKARDGLEISAVLTLPAGREAKNLATIVLPHGGPTARDSEEWDWWVQFLADRGYAVIQPNYRGSSGFGTAFAGRGEGQWGLAMQDDLNDALAWLAKEGIADPKRACIAGASYGGYAALRAAQRDGALYRCAVSFAGVSDLNALVRYDRQFLNSGRTVDWLREQAPNLKAVSPINFPDEFSIPLLLVHGKKDISVPVGQSRSLAERLRKAGKPVLYIEQPEADHHFSRQADRLEFLTALEKFLREHNPS
jgi:dipeptidyl aminopeptidase/acylaminoacyl peptidase